MLKSSIKKNYITLCATGETEKLESLIFKYTDVLKLRNYGAFSNGYRNGLYYSVKNLKIHTSRMLVSKGLRIENKLIRELINTWQGSASSYKFLKEIGTCIYESDAFPMPYNDWLYDFYKNYCLNHNLLNRLYVIMRYENRYNKENLEKLLGEYTTSNKSHSNNYITNVRDLQLKIIL